MLCENRVILAKVPKLFGAGVFCVGHSSMEIYWDADFVLLH